MKIFVDSEQRIKAVGSSQDPELTELFIEDNDDNPFKYWSTAKIKSYRCTVNDGRVTMMTPYRDSRDLDYIDEIGKENESLQDKALAADILLGKVEV